VRRLNRKFLPSFTLSSHCPKGQFGLELDQLGGSITGEELRGGKRPHSSEEPLMIILDYEETAATNAIVGIFRNFSPEQQRTILAAISSILVQTKERNNSSYQLHTGWLQ
jgi:hypothetical protein